MSSLAIIIPARNEEKRIGETVRDYLAYFTTLSKSKKIDSFKIIVVLNDCSDSTLEVVQKFSGKHLEILNFTKGGKGFAVIEGFKYALAKQYTHIGFTDADMSTRPEEFYRLFRKINSHGGVIASRYISGAVLSPPNTILRILASRIYNFFIRSLLFIPYRDTQCGAKIFTRTALQAVVAHIGMTRWAFDIELLYLLHRKGVKILEVPTVWSNKDYSTINFWSSGQWMTLAIIRLRLLHSPLKSLVRVYDRFTSLLRRRKRI